MHKQGSGPRGLAASVCLEALSLQLGLMRSLGVQVNVGMCVWVGVVLQTTWWCEM
jgi:hypothetical protein